MLPSITIDFAERAKTAVARSGANTLCMIVMGDTESETAPSYKTYTRYNQVQTTDWSADVREAIRMIFDGRGVRKLIVVSATGIPKITNAMLDGLVFDWMCMYADDDTTSAEVNRFFDYVNYKNEQKSVARKIRWVVPNGGGFPEATGTTATKIDGTYGVRVSGGSTITYDKSGTATEISTKYYVPRVAGILASCPITESVTYYALPEVSDIDFWSAGTNGVVAIVRDDDVIRLSTGVTASNEKIAIMEAKERIREDIVLMFKNKYLAKVRNTVDNQGNFASAVLGYLKDMAEQGVLNKEADISVEIDVDAMRDVWADEGVDVDSMTDAQIKNMPYKSYVYLVVRCSILDAMEDCKIDITLG